MGGGIIFFWGGGQDGGGRMSKFLAGEVGSPHPPVTKTLVLWNFVSKERFSSISDLCD